MLKKKLMKELIKNGVKKRKKKRKRAHGLSQRWRQTNKLRKIFKCRLN
jgi:hypothetical protein